MKRRFSLYENFHRLMNGESEGIRMPVIEWAAWWDKTLEEWEAEGMPQFQDGLEIQKYFGLDLNLQL